MRRIHGRVSWEEWLAANALTPEQRAKRPTEYTRRWRAKHPDYNREYMARWYAAHPGYQSAAGKRRRRKARRARRQAEYYRRWRLEHPDYHAKWRGERVEEERERIKRWRADNPDKVREQKRRWRKRRPRPEPVELPVLYADLRHGQVISLWRDELAMDLEQERVLAELEGRDPEEAVRAYRAKEYAFERMTMPINEGLI